MDQTRVLRAINDLQYRSRQRRNNFKLSAVSRTSDERLAESFNDRPIADVATLKFSEGTVLYLAYGSNLSAETFLGRRGIRPLSAINVVVPELVMTFDLAGVPYSEPCFANTRRRDPSVYTAATEKSTLSKNDYHKDHWHKGLVGVVYEVTKADYAHIIATEGGGVSYEDVLVDSFALSRDSKAPVPEHPTGAPFKAHTLLAPSDKDSTTTRPDPSWAQPSARYKKLIVDGANEHDFPLEYKDYLGDIRTYTIMSNRQQLGQFIFLSIWMPLLKFIFLNGSLFSDKDGRYPPWLVSLSSAIFQGMWASYDGFFKGVFGEGERTVEEEEKGIPRKRRYGDDYGTIESKDLV